MVRASWGGKRAQYIYPSVRSLPHCKHTSSYMIAFGAEENVKGRGQKKDKGKTGEVRIDGKYKEGLRHT